MRLTVGRCLIPTVSPEALRSPIEGWSVYFPLPRVEKTKVANEIRTRFGRIGEEVSTR